MILQLPFQMSLQAAVGGAILGTIRDFCGLDIRALKTPQRHQTSRLKIGVIRVVKSRGRDMLD
jgi:hypothetical protein